MVSLPRLQSFLSFLACAAIFLLPSKGQAFSEKEIRAYVRRAEQLESESNWEKAREIYELLLDQRDFGLHIRDRYQQAVRRTWQLRRHQDLSYRKEVLSIEAGAALRLYQIITKELLGGALEKAKLDPSKLFRKGMEELEAALREPLFLQQHLPDARLKDVQTFRTLLRKTWGKADSWSREEAVRQVGEVAMAAEIHLNLSATVVIMEFACGACYAIDDYTVYLTPLQLRELTDALSRNETMPNDASLIYGILPMNTSANMIPNASYGYLKINGFTDATPQEVDASLLALTNPMSPMSNSGIKFLILDLRHNNGGVLESAIETAKRFLATGIITSTLNPDSKAAIVYHAKNPGALSIPVVVLVDSETASAAEVLAGALKDNQRAVLIGQKTFGKGCTQCVLKLPSAVGGVPTGGLKLTTSRFFSPKGVPYSGRGIVPNLLIDDDMAQSEAAMSHLIEKAIEELNRMALGQK